MICDVPVVSDVLVAFTERSASHPDSGLAVLDTAAALTVMSEAWWKDYKSRLESLGLENEIGHVGIDELFRFGDGVTHQCRSAKTLPIAIASHKTIVTVCLLPGLSLNLGRDFHDKHGTKIGHGERTFKRLFNKPRAKCLSKKAEAPSNTTTRSSPRPGQPPRHSTKARIPRGRSSTQPADQLSTGRVRTSRAQACRGRTVQRPPLQRCGRSPSSRKMARSST